jgi:hypothetical protein
MNSLKTKILETVQKNNIRMIPKWKFVLYSSLGIIGTFFIFVLAVFLFSLTLFLLSRYGFMYMPFFGFMATLRALDALPQLLLGCSIILLIIVEALTRYYTFSFKRPLLLMLLLITGGALVISYGISESPIHERMRDYARDHHLGIVSKAYERPRHFKDRGNLDVLRGEVISASSSQIAIQLFDGKVILARASTTRLTKDLPALGEDVVFLGDFVEDIFEIVDIHDVPKMFFRNGPPHQGGKPSMYPNDGRKDFGRIRNATTSVK